MSSAAESDLNDSHGEPIPVGTFVESKFMASLRQMKWEELLAFLNPPEVRVHIPNPKRQAAGRLNRQKRKGITAAGRQKLRESAARNRPWQHSTGPKSVLGKQRSADNGRHRQTGTTSIREMESELRAAMACGLDLRGILEMLPSGLSDVDFK